MTFENNPKVMLLWNSPLRCMSPACKYDQMKAVSANTKLVIETIFSSVHVAGCQQPAASPCSAPVVSCVN